MAYPASPNDGDYHVEDGIRRRYVAAEGSWVKDPVAGEATYGLECPYSATAEVDIPAVTGGGTVVLAHDFSIVGAVEVIEVATGDRLLPDWAHFWADDPAAPIEITFAETHTAGTFTARITGRSAIPCGLTANASAWDVVDLALTGAGTITPRVDHDGALGDVEWDWGDGSNLEAVTSGVAASHAYTDFTGTAKLRVRQGTTVSQFESGGDPWSFDLAKLTKLEGLTFLTVNDSLVHGSVGALAGLPLVRMYLYNSLAGGDIASLATSSALADLRLYNSNVSGEIGPLGSVTTLTDVWLFGTSVYGDIGGLSTLSSLEELRVYSLNGTDITGTMSALSGLTSLTHLHLNGTGVSGTIADLSALTSLVELRLQSTGVTGDVSNLAGITTLSQMYLDNTGVSGDVGTLSPLTNLTRVYLHHVSTTGDPTAVATASVAGLSIVEYYDVGTPPSIAELDTLIGVLAGGSVSNGTLRIAGTNPAPTNTGGITTLQGRGWNVTTN